MRGITPVVATILLLLITISITGVSFVFMQRTAQTSTLAGESQLNQTAGQVLTRFRIENIGNGKAYIRNMGSTEISSSILAVYINNNKVDYTLASGIGPGSTREIILLPASCKGFISGNIVRITTEMASDSMPIPGHADGVYKIKPESQEFDAYCDMTTDGGGWTLLMKAVGNDDVFSYEKNYWTSVNTLNENDLALGNSNAKYNSFNDVPLTEIRAEWPTIGHVMQETVPLQTALLLFQRADSGRVLAAHNAGMADYGDIWAQFPGPVPKPQPSSPFPYQSGYQTYGFNLQCNSGARVRWGWEWNNENDCGTNDASAGIGIQHNSGNRAASMGGWVACCSSKPNGPYPYQVRIWGR